VRVPEEAGNGKAKVRLSFPGWKEAKVAPATFEVPVVDAPPADERPKVKPTVVKQPQREAPLSRIGLALHAYHDAFGHFPPAALVAEDGKPLLSWRVALLPFLGEDQLYGEFKLNESWDSPYNKKLLPRMPQVYALPDATPGEASHTLYRVFVGPGTVFENGPGTFLGTITDGVANTLLVVEAGESVPWTKPQELPYDPDRPLPRIGGMSPEGFYALYCDGDVRWIRNDFDEGRMRLALVRHDGYGMPYSEPGQP
jgi:hypothetical protein